VADIFCFDGYNSLLWHNVVKRSSGRTMNLNFFKNFPWAAVGAIAVFVLMGIVAHLFGK
jgi:hypothetical protein